MPVALDLTLYEGVPALAVAAIALTAFVAFFIKGAVGVGSLTPIIVITALILEPHHAVLLALIVNIVSQLQFVPTAFRHGDWSVARHVIPANFAGAVLGIYIFGRIESGELALILGVALGGIVVVDLTGALERLGARYDVRRPTVVWSLSAFAGLISGVTGAGGLLFLALYLRTVCADRMALRGTIMLLSLMVVAWRVIVLSASGFVDLTLVAEGALLAPLVVLGGVAGARLFRRLNEDWFAMAVRGVVLMGAAGLIWRGVSDLL